MTNMFFKKIPLFYLIFFLSIEGYAQSNASQSSGGFATVKGKVTNATSDKRDVEIAVSDWALSIGKRRNYYAEIDSAGNFELTFYVFHTQDVLFTFANRWHGLFVCPNDTVIVNIDADHFPEGNQYDGCLAKANKEYIEHRGYSRDKRNSAANQQIKKQKEMSFEEYLVWKDTLYSVEVRAIEQYADQMNLSPFLKKWILTDTYLRRKKDEISYYCEQQKFDKDLKSIVKEIDFSDPDLLYNSSALAGLGSIMVLYAEMFTIFHPKPDDVAMIEMPFGTDATSYQIQKDEQEELEAFMEYMDIKNDTAFSDFLLAHRYSFNHLEKGGVAKVKDVDLYLENISDDRIRSVLMFNAEKTSYQNRDRSTEMNASPHFLSDLINENMGGVTFIYFWGTWCAPCISHLKKMHEVETRFKDERVGFNYYCVKSDKQRWENLVKELNLRGEHKLLSFSEYNYYASEFNIVGFPRVLIIDKNGQLDRAITVFSEQMIGDTIQGYLDTQ